MKQEELASVVRSLDAALEAIGMTENEDTRIMPIYAEYWVANELAKRGHEVEVVSRRSHDLFLPAKNLRIEVKSGKYYGMGSGASFYKGSQITDGKFDYCVFVSYDIDFQIKEALIFSRKELEEVATKPRPQLAAHPTTNSCLLLRYDTLESYLRNVAEKDRLDIEIDLHKHPERYSDSWSKIV
jgi:hypothetical protein